ncbi:hypothetical protein [Lactobacillus gallinarum]|uniref:hypothetical protein n=1 Tax=Lactobacillus gallinarum TaxID=52242 RepID=UPI001F9BA6CB|nr:hypothetical protein [Candidatus Coprovivens excrementavium]
MQQNKETNLDNERIEGTSLELALYAGSMKQLAKDNKLLSDFFKKNSEFTSSIVKTIMDVITCPANLKSKSDKKKQAINSKELEQYLILCAESLQDQSEIFNYCVNTNEKEENHD